MSTETMLEALRARLTPEEQRELDKDPETFLDRPGFWEDGTSDEEE